MWCFRRMARFRKKKNIFIRRTKISMPVTLAVKVVLYNVKSQLGVLNIKEFLTGISYRKPLQKSLLFVNRKVTSYNIFRSIYSGQSFFPSPVQVGLLSEWPVDRLLKTIAVCCNATGGKQKDKERASVF